MLIASLKTRITPQIALLMHPMKEELDYALSIEVPICKGRMILTLPYTSSIHNNLPGRLKQIGRPSKCIHFSLPSLPVSPIVHLWVRQSRAIRDGQETVTDFTSNEAMTTMILRGIPPILHGIAVLFMPTYWTVQRTIRDSLTILGPEISRRRRSEAEDPSYKKPVDLLQGMKDLAKPGSKQSTARDLAHRQLVMSLAAVHTTAGQAANTLFDLCVHPEYFDILREEIITDVVNDPTGWDKQSLNKLKKLDSFLKEAQRMNPPSLRKNRPC